MNPDRIHSNTRTDLSGIPADTLREILRTMLRIRLAEERIADLIIDEKITTPCHLSTGQEAIAAGVCATLARDDLVFSTHRCHGHYIAKGGDIREMMAEIFCRSNGCSGGRGGSMHLSHPETGFVGSSSIVGGSIPLAVGAGLASSIRHENKITVVFFGDGAANEGVMYESLNFASLKRIPVIFVCENNLYSSHLPIRECLANVKIYQIPRTFKIPTFRIDGNDPLTIFTMAKKARDLITEKGGPVFLECLTYRWRGHVGPHDDLEKGLRSAGELKKWLDRDPIARFHDLLIRSDVMTEGAYQQIVSEVSAEIEDSVQYALNSRYPDPSDLMQYIFTE